MEMTLPPSASGPSHTDRAAAAMSRQYPRVAAMIAPSKVGAPSLVLRCR
jgi:hypothetical protein